MNPGDKHAELRLSYVLRDLLKRNDMTASHLSRQARVPKSVLSDWLAGTNPRNLPQLMRVAKCLGVSLEMLCFGVDERGAVGEGYRIKGVIEGEFVIVKRL